MPLFGLFPSTPPPLQELPPLKGSTPRFTLNGSDSSTTTDANTLATSVNNGTLSDASSSGDTAQISPVIQPAGLAAKQSPDWREIRIVVGDGEGNALNGHVSNGQGLSGAESLPSPLTIDSTAPLLHPHHEKSMPLPPLRIPSSNDHRHKSSETTDYEGCNDDGESTSQKESFRQLLYRHSQNLLHFFVEDWFISGMLGAITAVLSICVDVSYECLNELRAELFDQARAYDKRLGFVTWVAYLVVFVTAAALVCRYVAVQAIGSGIPEVKVIMNGFMLENYLSFRTLVAKVLSLTLTLGSGLPVGKEGPFVHMGAIVGTLLSKMTKAWQSNAFFSNEGRELEILSSGCSVGIACTFSSPAGAVLYGIESTHKYFAVKNYWRAFFATTCSALIFRFANRLVIPPHIAGTITAYYQTSFPNEVFLIEEIPVFVLIGVLSGLFGALFVLLHRVFANFRKTNRYYRAVFGRNSFAFTVCMALLVGVITYPDGMGKYIAGKYTFRETLSDFISNCTMSTIPSNLSRPVGCGRHILDKWTPYENYGITIDPTEAVLHEGNITHGGIRDVMHTLPARPRIMPSLFGYVIVNYFLVAVCIALAIPAGIFVPSFVIGACGGRIVGECMYMLFPNGLRGPNGPQIFPGLYAVVGAAAYTGAVTHSLSIAVIVCETTGQLSPLLPVLIALMVANAVSSFLQPSIYESIIEIKKYPHLAELPPSRASVHTLKVEQIMVKDLVFITKQTTYRELRALLLATDRLRSYPLVTDDAERLLLGSVARKYLNFLLTTHLGPDPSLLPLSRRLRRRNRNPSELLGSFRHNSTSNLRNALMLNDRNVHGNTLLSISPLHEEYQQRNSPLGPLLMRHQNVASVQSWMSSPTSLSKRSQQLDRTIDLDEVAIDAAPFQLVLGTSLYKVHTLFALLGLNHAYVTHRGRLIGVVSLRELRLALANIYTRGAVPTAQAANAGQLQRLNSRAEKPGQSPPSSPPPPSSFQTAAAAGGVARKLSIINSFPVVKKLTKEFLVGGYAGDLEPLPGRREESGSNSSGEIGHPPMIIDDDPFTEADGSAPRSRKRDNSISEFLYVEENSDDSESNTSHVNDNGATLAPLAPSETGSKPQKGRKRVGFNLNSSGGEDG